MSEDEIVMLLHERLHYAEEGSTNSVELSREEALAILAYFEERPCHD